MTRYPTAHKYITSFIPFSVHNSHTPLTKLTYSKSTLRKNKEQFLLCKIIFSDHIWYTLLPSDHISRSYLPQNTHTSPSLPPYTHTNTTLTHRTMMHDEMLSSRLQVSHRGIQRHIFCWRKRREEKKNTEESSFSLSSSFPFDSISLSLSVVVQWSPSINLLYLTHKPI